jgi:flavin reductase (DIM6/NTAB) family NADH-FMN oxidoreductase RutF
LTELRAAHVSEAFDAVDESSFRQVMSRFAKCVTVTTTMGRNGPVGCSTTSVLSLSTNPPTVLVSLTSTGRTLHDLLAVGAFAVNVLSGRQAQLVHRFATGDPYRRFQGVSYEECSGVPVLVGTSATIVCRVRHVVPVLDHTLLIGTVWRTRIATESPLVLLDGKPHTAVATQGVA